MLAIISPSHASLSTSSAAMSLALLPTAASHMAYNPQSGLFVSAPSPSKRPKLSLNTSNVPSVFGNSSTSLRLDALSASSPTARNTLSNALKPGPGQRTPHPRSQRLPTLTPIITNVVASERTWSPISNDRRVADDSSSSPSLSPHTSLSSVESAPFNPAPYQIAQNVSSILTNGPFTRKRTRTNPFVSPAPVMSSATKSVVFRNPLTEDIQTTTYTLRHSDIESSVSTISTLEISMNTEDNNTLEATSSSTSSQKLEFAAAQPNQERAPAAGVQSATEQANIDQSQSSKPKEKLDEDENDDRLGSATPLAGRRKRHRQWVWTLGPVDSEPTQSDLPTSVSLANPEAP